MIKFLLTLREASENFSISIESLRYSIRCGYIKEAGRRGKKIILIDPVEVTEFLNGNNTKKEGVL